jgi:hypothetical protein
MNELVNPGREEPSRSQQQDGPGDPVGSGRGGDRARYHRSRVAEATVSQVGSIAENAIDAAVESVQEALGVKSGDFAGIYFSGSSYDALFTILSEYARAEIGERARAAAEARYRGLHAAIAVPGTAPAVTTGETVRSLLNLERCPVCGDPHRGDEP